MKKPAIEIIDNFLSDVRAKKNPLGMFHNLNSPTLVEIMGAAGHRFVIFDQEHTSTNHETLVNLIRAAELYDMFVLVRVESPDPYAAIKALDAGAHGVWVQHLKDAEAVREYVSALTFPAIGDRNFCTFPRACENGIGDPLKFVEYSNTAPLIVVGLNTEEILEELDEVLEIPRVEAFALNYADVIVRTGYGDFDDFHQMHNIAKAVNKKIRDAGKLNMMPLMALDMSDPKNAADFLNEQSGDFWFIADLNCFLSGLSNLKKIQKQLESLNTGSPEEEATEMDSDGIVRTC